MSFFLNKHFYSFKIIGCHSFKKMEYYYLTNGKYISGNGQLLFDVCSTFHLLFISPGDYQHIQNLVPPQLFYSEKKKPKL